MSTTSGLKDKMIRDIDMLTTFTFIEKLNLKPKF